MRPPQVFAPCHICALDELLVESRTWDWLPREPGALCYCLVHTPRELARMFGWLDWLAWIFWDPTRLDR